ncbi:hypothetical protein KC678_00455 [Candidatus Dojkabacteria bacterium]|uniref:Uncharacterized protein n=1 Tax=Candidatus Dojkabacteria bacterium TaxID=2099670 RepID=A0A955L1I8_9BACT|nr:hypothetical protein [Candidatus Dojkabacteria bacterium]
MDLLSQAKKNILALLFTAIAYYSFEPIFNRDQFTQRLIQLSDDSIQYATRPISEQIQFILEFLGETQEFEIQNTALIGEPEGFHLGIGISKDILEGGIYLNTNEPAMLLLPNSAEIVDSYGTSWFKNDLDTAIKLLRSIENAHDESSIRITFFLTNLERFTVAGNEYTLAVTEYYDSIGIPLNHSVAFSQTNDRFNPITIFYYYTSQDNRFEITTEFTNRTTEVQNQLINIFLGHLPSILSENSETYSKIITNLGEALSDFYNEHRETENSISIA